MSGTHLTGKSSVRSECWPCGKMTVFDRNEGKAETLEIQPGQEKPAATASIGGEAHHPESTTSSSAKPASESAPTKELKKAPLPPPDGGDKNSVPPLPPKKTTKTIVNPFSQPPTTGVANPFLAAAATSSKPPPFNFSAAPGSSSKFSWGPAPPATLVPVYPSPGVDKPRMSPPFRFAPSPAAPPPLGLPTAVNAAEPKVGAKANAKDESAHRDPQSAALAKKEPHSSQPSATMWMCKSCGKTKELSGEHLVQRCCAIGLLALRKEKGIHSCQQ